ncbi:MAG: hypothetical protein ACLS69_02490 [Butyricicoccus sp.]
MDRQQLTAYDVVNSWSHERSCILFGTARSATHRYAAAIERGHQTSR